MKHFKLAALAALFAIVGSAAGCTLKAPEVPDLGGPSEYGTSITVAITPDVLEQNGASQSMITITARDGNGQALRNVPLRTEIRVNGANFDFGTLSARSVVTAGDGRATLVYTAPPAPAVAVDPFTIVDIAVTPVGSDFSNAVTRTASVRVVPPGTITPPDGLRPAFTFTPTNPTDHQRVLFDASTSEAPGNNPIQTYSWRFGDGRTGTGRVATHDYSSAGTYVVTLTVADGYGRSASTSRSLTVNAGVNPTVAFSFSPTEPTPGTTVHFNASETRGAPGRGIVSYQWDFGDGTSGSGVQVSHPYPMAGSYTVTLVVTDDAGRTSAVAKAVPVKIPEVEAPLVAPSAKTGGTLRH